MTVGYTYTDATAKEFGISSSVSVTATAKFPGGSASATASVGASFSEAYTATTS